MIRAWLCCFAGECSGMTLVAEQILCGKAAGTIKKA
jgi:hypothetical protein